MDLNKHIREIKDFPIKWIDFKDISTLLQNEEAFKYVIDEISEKIKDVDVIIWLDARGFIFAWALSYKLGIPLSIVRKPWKLPYKTISVDYELEYWKNTFELNVDAVKKWEKVAIIDDLLATWWTALASCQLVEQLWWIVNSIHFIINLKDLWWEEKLNKYKINSLLEY